MVDLDKSPYYGNLQESENEVTLWATNNVRFWLGISSSLMLIIALIWASFVPFVYPDTKKPENRVINTISYIFLVVSGIYAVGSGYIIAHDEPLLVMDEARKRKITAYKMAVREELAKKKELASILPQQPSQAALPPQNTQQANVPMQQPPKVMQQASRGESLVITPSNYQNIQQYEQEEPSELDFDFTEINGKQIDTIIYDLAACRNSILLCSQPGTGKTTLTLAWLWTVMNRFPETQFFIIGQKFDVWLGLGKIPGILTVVGRDVKPTLKKVDNVAKILNERCLTPESERNFKDKPIRLLFDDYTATYSSIKSAGKKALSDFVQNIAYLITVGREFNVCLYVAAHSFNLKTLGLEGADIRDCLALMCLGFESYTEDGKSGGFDSIETVLKNHFIVKNNREELNITYKELKEISIQNKKQLLLCTLNGISFRLLSDLRWIRENESVTGEIIDNQSKPKKLLNLKKVEIDNEPLPNSPPGGEIEKIETWLKVSYPDELNLLPAGRGGLYAMLIDDIVVYVGKSNEIFRRINIDKHGKIPMLQEANSKGLKTEVAYFTSSMDDENRSKWEEYLYNKYKCDWNGRSADKCIVPESIDEKLVRQDQAIFEFCYNYYVENNKPVRVRVIQNTKLNNEFKLNSDKIKRSLERLEKLGLGTLNIEMIGGSESWQFTPEID